jgi:hypothetical protein
MRVHCVRACSQYRVCSELDRGKAAPVLTTRTRTRSPPHCYYHQMPPYYACWLDCCWYYYYDYCYCCSPRCQQPIYGQFVAVALLCVCVFCLCANVLPAKISVGGYISSNLSELFLLSFVRQSGTVLSLDRYCTSLHCAGQSYCDKTKCNKHWSLIYYRW